MKSWVRFIYFCSAVLQVFGNTHFHQKSIMTNANLAAAAKAVIDEVYIKEALTVNVISPNQGRGFPVRDFLDQLLSFELIFGTINRDLTAVRRILNVIVVQTLIQFEEIFRHVNPDSFRYSGFFVVVLVDGEISRIQDIFGTFWKLMIYNVVALYEANDGQVSVETFFPFSPKNCNDIWPRKVCVYKDEKFTGKFFPEKMTNLFNCPVRLAITNDSHPFIFVSYLPHGVLELKGQNIDVLNALAESLHFKHNFTYIGSEGISFENGTQVGPLKHLQDDNADLVMGNYWLRAHRLKYFDTTTSYTSEHLSFVIPAGQKLTAMETLAFPFQFYVWICILSCFAVGCLVIFMANTRDCTIRALIIGHGIRHPSLNMFSAFIGGIQRQVPKENFARFLLTVFLLYSLVMRTLYQGSFYRILQSGMQKREVQTIQEMIDKNFTLFVYHTNLDSFAHIESVQDRIVSYTPGQFLSLLKRTQHESNFKGAVARSLTRLVYLNQFRTDDDKIIICKESFLVIPCVIYTRKNFFLLDALNYKIEIFKSSGLLTYWYKKQVYASPFTTVKKKPLKVLELSKLLGCFEMLLLGFFVGFSAFLSELYLFRRQPHYM